VSAFLQGERLGAPRRKIFMSASRLLFFGTCTLALVLMFSPDARVSEMDQKVIGTFSVPVMIPGQILPPGTYVFKMADVGGSPDVVRVETADETTVLATALTIPRYRLHPGGRADVFQLEERSADSPQAIRSWFYPGFTIGHEFIYPKTARVATVESGVINNPPAAPVEETAAAAPQEPTVVAENTPSTEQSQTTEAAPAPAQEELPKTASSMPLVALVGMLLLGAAAGLRAFAARRS
jgi:LPXTG-motif cell wall-anchored protein